MYKTEQIYRLRERTMVMRGKWLRGRIDWEFGIDIYILNR